MRKIIKLKRLTAGLLSTAVVLGASGTSGILAGINAVADPVETPQEECSGSFKDLVVHLPGDSEANPPIASSTAMPFPDNNLTWHYRDGVLTISGTGAMPNWITGSDNLEKIDATHWGHRPWDSFRDQIKEVVVEEGVTSIGDYAFCHFDFDDGVTITIPASVKVIGTGVFFESKGLKSIDIPDTVETINNEAFWRCSNLKAATLPNQLTEIGNYVFAETALESIVIPEPVTRIGRSAFDSCTGLTEVVIPQNVSSIGDWAFAGSTSLSRVEFKGTEIIPEMGKAAFVGCPCVEGETKGLIIESCKYLDAYLVKEGWYRPDLLGEHVYPDYADPYDYRVNIDKTHDIEYSDEGGAVITETCHAEGCAHTAETTLSVPQSSYTYTGSQIKPVVNTYGEIWAGTGDQRPADTEIEYENNIYVGTAEATLTISNATSSGTARISFDIVPPAGLIDVTDDGWTGVYDGESHSITVKDIPDGATVTYGTTPGDCDSTVNPAYTDVGEYRVYYKVKTTAGQEIIGSAVVKITPKPITDPTVTVEVIPDPDGGEPTVKVKDGDKDLTEDEDYTVDIEETTDPESGEPKYKIKVTGKRNYKDEVEKTVPEESDGIDVTADGWTGVYDGEPHSITVKNIPDDATVTYGTTPGTYNLPENPAYTDVGEYVVYYKVTKPDGQEATGSAIVKITPKPITDPTVTVEVVPNPDDPSNPKVTVKDGDKPLILDKDYEVEINKTTDPDGGEPQTTVKITGIKNYEDDVIRIIPGDPSSPKDDDDQNPFTGNPFGQWGWILLSAAGATGITVIKSKSKRKEG